MLAALVQGSVINDKRDETAWVCTRKAKGEMMDLTSWWGFGREPIIDRLSAWCPDGHTFRWLSVFATVDIPR